MDNTANTRLFNDLVNKQLQNIPPSKKLQYNDIKRLCGYINGNIFDESKCTLWSGYVTNYKNPQRGVYINFYFRKKKVALHRLLYINYVGELDDDEYIKYVCMNKGRCCNIHHIKKFKYDKSVTHKKAAEKKDKNKKKNKKKRDKIYQVEQESRPEDFILVFD